MELEDFPEPPMPFTLPMKGERMHWCCEVIGWTHGELIRRLKVRENTVRGWLTNKRFIPTPVAVWLETVAAMHLAIPAPFFWHEDPDTGDRRHSSQSEHYERSYTQRAPLPKGKVALDTDDDPL